MKKIALLFVFCLIFCGCTTRTENQNNNISDEIVEEEETMTRLLATDIEEEEEIEIPDYLGTWIRQNTYVNELPQNSGPATLVLEEIAFHSSTDVCTVTGDLLVEGDQMTMNILTNDCPDPANLQSITHTYTITEDGNTMTFVVIYSGSEVKEIYSRATE